MVVARAVLLAALLTPACNVITESFVTNDFSGDPYPIHVNTETGGLLVGLRIGVDEPDRLAILDVLSPITVIDPGDAAAPSVTSATLTVLGENAAGDALDLPRARLPDKRLVSIHPCAEQTCMVGTTGAQRAFDAIIGADALAGDTLRIQRGDDQVRILADVAGDDRDRLFACDAVFPAPYRGGGTLVIAGAEIGFSGRRVTMQACLGNDPRADLAQGERGADALLVLSTGVGITILGESAYERYRLIRPEIARPLAELPEDSVVLASGLVEGRRGVIDKLALVAASSSSPRAPCRQTYAHHLLLPGDCGLDEDDCPCEGGDAFCPVPSSVELTPAGGLPVLIVPDSNGTLQALRTELRPDQPEVDGILGLDALGSAELDIDYPHNRVLARCKNESCLARPALSERADRPIVRGCID